MSHHYFGAVISFCRLIRGVFENETTTHDIVVQVRTGVRIRTILFITTDYNYDISTFIRFEKITVYGRQILFDQDILLL